MSQTIGDTTRNNLIRMPSGGFLNFRHSLLWCLCLAAVSIAVMMSTPAMAGTQYMAGSPELSVYIAGTNEYSPGQDVPLHVVIENKGVNQFKFVKSGIVDTEDLTNTAKHLTVTLGTDDAPLAIKSDSQTVGDLLGSNSATVLFNLKINRDAPAGTYNLPVTLNYTYLYQVEQYGDDTVQYYYKSVNDIVSLPIKIKSNVQIDVLSVDTENLNVGNEGYIILKVKNTGHEDGKKSVVRLSQNDGSPVTPTEGSAYIGDFAAGSTADCRFKVMVSGDAEAKSYPLDVYVDYQNSEQDQVTSESETIGIPVGKKVDFAVAYTNSTISPGAKSVIRVGYQNTGGATVYNAQARISAVDPFTSNDDTSYLGTMAPGEIKEAAFDVSVDKGATLKDYGIDSEMSYRDALDNTYTSTPMKVNVHIVAAKGVLDILANPLILLVIVIAIIAAAGYFLYKRRNIPQ
ncbi:MAG: CARDB domain-containing protein [Methanoregula sp.]